MNYRSIIKQKVLAAAATMLLGLPAALSAGTIMGSPHDFRGYEWSESGQICTPCHTPHQTKTMPLPLWDYMLKTDTYEMYADVQSPDMKEGGGIRPKNSSKICLSCHDGTVAPETFGDVSESAGRFHGYADFDTDVRSNHPVSFVYDTSLAAADGDLYDPSTKLSGVVDSTGTISDDMLFDGKMECSSCHDVHNTRAVEGTKLLLKDTAGSGLCLTCHDK